MDRLEYENKQCYLENPVVREACKQRTACLYKVAMAFWINIYRCQLYSKHGHLSVNQLRDDNYFQALYVMYLGVDQTICVYQSTHVILG